MLHRRQLLARTGALALAGGTALAAQAQDLPNKTIRILVPFSAGGSPDLIARLVAQQFTEQTGVPVVIDNRLGANGIIASEAVANAVPDGTTILLNTGSHTINPSIYKKLPYDTVRDLAPISLLTIAPTLVLVVAPNFPAKNFQEFLALARQPDTRISFGSPGIGNTLHLSGELLNIKGGTHMLHVPYKGAAPALQATVAGEVSCTFLSTTAASIAIKSGQVRPLAVTSATRLASLPDVPTIAESGVKGFDYNGGWMGLFAPGKTPPAIVKRLSQEFNKVLQVASVREKMSSWETPPLGTTPEEFARFVQADLAKYAEIVRDAHVPMQ
jgi:tripartite-type tricarboxylate transporter receptor subunit TctC